MSLLLLNTDTIILSVGRLINLNCLQWSCLDLFLVYDTSIVIIGRIYFLEQFFPPRNY